MSDGPDAAPGYWTCCDECEEKVADSEAVDVTWANVSFCSGTCRDRWATKTEASLR